MRHLFHFRRGEDHLLYELPDGGMDNVKFSFQASMGCFGVMVCSVNAAYCALVHAPNLWRKECVRVRQLSRPDRPI